MKLHLSSYAYMCDTHRLDSPHSSTSSLLL